MDNLDSLRTKYRLHWNLKFDQKIPRRTARLRFEIESSVCLSSDSHILWLTLWLPIVLGNTRLTSASLKYLGLCNGSDGNLLMRWIHYFCVLTHLIPLNTWGLIIITSSIPWSRYLDNEKTALIDYWQFFRTRMASFWQPWGKNFTWGRNCLTKLPSGIWICCQKLLSSVKACNLEFVWTRMKWAGRLARKFVSTLRLMVYAWARSLLDSSKFLKVFAAKVRQDLEGYFIIKSLNFRWKVED